MEILKPIVINDNKSGETYTLEFNRESVIFTNRQGFKASEVTDNFVEMFPILFYGAFRMHHKNISRQQTDNILYNLLKGVSSAVAERLIKLYALPNNTLIRDDEDIEENPNVTISL